MMAKVLDVLGVLAVVAVFGTLAWLSPDERLRFLLIVVTIVVAGFGFAVYTIVAEWRHGQTYGKRRYGLFVVQ